MNMGGVYESVVEQQVQEVGQDLLSQYSINRYTLVAAVVILFLGVLINKFSNVLVDRAVERRSGDEHAAKTGKRLTAYIIFSLTLIFVLGAFGVPPSALGTAVGLIGLGLSFALKDMIANFISGILILISQPFKIGDQINVDGQEGTLKEINLRASSIRTYDGREVIVPNSELYNKTVINNTAYDERRFDVIVGISYDDDIRKAKEIAEEALKEAEKVEDQPEPQVLVDELDDSSVNIRLRGWTRPSRASIVSASSELTGLVKQKYDEEGIDIPFPIRTVYMEE